VVTAAARLVELVAEAGGPLPFSAVVELALYDPDLGFYATAGRAGRRGDFLTSPEVGPLFGEVVAQALDLWWTEAGEPSEWRVVEGGAGPGGLARSVLAAAPRCVSALRWTLVERSARQRELHLPLLDRWSGQVRSEEALPPPGTGADVVLANELLDNLPFDLWERTGDGWSEIRIGAAGGTPVEVPVPAPPPRVIGDLDAAIGARAPVQAAAAAWLRAALALRREGGRIVVIDYAATTSRLAARPWLEWVRTYRQHGRGAHPIAHLGEQDVTCEVCTDQLASVAPPTADRSQAEWLRAHGIDELVADGRRTWRERASIGDLAAVRARSRVTEADALLDPSGLGAFRVLEWL
jgi:SAM-dependent MidA family methyltransferase